jgi:hypothetical protein
MWYGRPGVEPDELAVVQDQAQGEVSRRVGVLRLDRPAIPVAGRTAVIVDEGMATGMKGWRPG